MTMPFPLKTTGPRTDATVGSCTEERAQRVSTDPSYDVDLIAPIALRWSLVFHVLR